MVQYFFLTTNQHQPGLSAQKSTSEHAVCQMRVFFVSVLQPQAEFQVQILRDKLDDIVLPICLNLLTCLISHRIVFFSHNKSALVGLSNAEIISRTTYHNNYNFFIIISIVSDHNNIKLQIHTTEMKLSNSTVSAQKMQF